MQEIEMEVDDQEQATPAEPATAAGGEAKKSTEKVMNQSINHIVLG